MPSSPSPFVRKTFDLVSDASTDSIVSWSAAGDSFIIHHPHKFQKEILPYYFKHNNLCSFIRQLNTYGFHKVVNSTKNNGQTDNKLEELEFQQPHFLRGQIDSLQYICRRSKATKRTHTQRVVSDALATTSDPMKVYSLNEINCLAGSNNNLNVSQNTIVNPYDSLVDYNSLLQDRTQLANAILTITARQKETESRIQTVVTQLREAKQLIYELENSEPDMQQPMKKKFKAEPVETPTENFLWNAPCDLFTYPESCAAQQYSNEAFDVFDINEFLLV